MKCFLMFLKITGTLTLGILGAALVFIPITLLADAAARAYGPAAGLGVVLSGIVLSVGAFVTAGECRN